jgi:hypothetical protein
MNWGARWETFGEICFLNVNLTALARRKTQEIKGNMGKFSRNVLF